MSYDMYMATNRNWIIYWRVTRSLVSYDYIRCVKVPVSELKGHQIIGELRLHDLPLYDQLLHWRVTRSLVSYDLPDLSGLNVLILKGHQIIGELRLTKRYLSSWVKLKGHQIIGELRRDFPLGWTHCQIEGSPDHWWVTTWMHVFII